MGVLDAYAVDGVPDFIASLFGLIPAGFCLGLFVGLLGFGVFSLFNLLTGLLRR